MVNILGKLCPILCGDKMDLKDYILTYEVDGKVVVNLFDYYERYVKPLDKRFETYSYYNDKLVLCYFKDHNDVNPSMGYVKHRKFKKVYSCHCFGCGKTADVVRVHQILSQQYKNIKLSERDACYELASMFDVPISEDEISEDDYEGRFNQSLKRVEHLSNRYTVREFSQAIMDMRCSGNIDLNKVNMECIKMTATVKQLYD